MRRIVYLGGLTADRDLSPHMRSRAEVARILLDGTVPAVMLHAAMIIGSGSVSMDGYATGIPSDLQLHLLDLLDIDPRDIRRRSVICGNGPADDVVKRFQ
ncbi:hypothetical protein ACWEPC_28495 [Nonomuraea sp. NPDC004297]